MRNQILSSHLQRLNYLFNQTTLASGSNIEIQAHWAKYLCVLSAGFIENAISEVYIEYVEGKANDEVVNFATSTLSKIQNPKVEKFINNARSFRVSWAEELEDYVEQDGRLEAINSIMGNRHRIAHGKSSGITIARLRQWLDKSIEVIEFIEQQLNS